MQPSAPNGGITQPCAQDRTKADKVSMPQGICSNCGEDKELVLAGCVCGSCSDSLDTQWAGVPATDWVLIVRKDYDIDLWAALRESLRNAGEEQPPEPPRDVERPPFRPSVNRFGYRNTTYAEMKSLWATRSQPNRTCFVRPATPEEIAGHGEVSWSDQIYEETTRIWKKWGFDDEGQPLHGVWDNDARERRTQADGEIDTRREQLGFLGFDDLGEPLYQVSGVERIRARQVPNPGCGLSQVAGMAALKEKLMDEVIGPFREPELYLRYRVSIPNGILFFGPPGCGKTYIARSLAEELGWSFQHCRPSDVASPYIHDTVSRIRGVFSTAIEKAPSIVFIDEFEAFVPARSELGGDQQYKAEEVNEFLANLEGCAERRVLVIAATNEPEKIDPAVRRSGRFDKVILIPPPDAEARLAMLEFHLNNRPAEAALDIAGIAAILEGYSASDIKLLVDEAARMALKRTESISTGTLLAALERVPASITRDDIQRYSAFQSRGI